MRRTTGKKGRTAASLIVLIIAAVVTWWQQDGRDDRKPAPPRIEQPAPRAEEPRREPAPRPQPQETRREEPSPSADEGLESVPSRDRALVARTLELIRADGPFPYDKDGTTFQNREGRLPGKPRGYYREYTVAPEGARNRGPKRIVTGRDGEVYYTADHYRTFVRIGKR